MAATVKKKRRRGEASTEDTLKGRLLKALGVLPPIVDLGELLDATSLQFLRAPAVAPKNIASPALIEGFSYASRGSLPDVVFEEQIMTGKAHEIIVIRHYMKSHGYDFAVQYTDGFLLYREFQVSETHAYDGRVVYKLIEGDDDQKLTDLFTSILGYLADYCSMSMCNTVIGSWATALSLNTEDKAHLISSLSIDMSVNRDSLLTHLHEQVKAAPAGRGLRRVLAQTLGLFLAGETLENILNQCGHLGPDELYGMLTHCSSFGLPLFKRDTVEIVNEAGNEAEVVALRNTDDDDLVHCVPNYVHAGAIKNIRLDSQVFIQRGDLYRVHLKRKKQKERGNKVKTFSIKASLLKSIAQRNVLAAPPQGKSKSALAPVEADSMPRADPFA